MHSNLKIGYLTLGAGVVTLMIKVPDMFSGPPAYVDMAV